MHQKDFHEERKKAKQNLFYTASQKIKQNSVLWSFKNKNNNLRRKKNHISWVNLQQDNTLMPINSVLGDKSKLQHYLILKQTQTTGYPRTLLHL